MRKSTLSFLACALLITGAARANHYADTYVIPAVGHVESTGGAMWMSDLTIRNIGTTPCRYYVIELRGKEA